MIINMPEGARGIIQELNKAGYEAYIVGGCVRDSLLNKTPSDWDITTSATPVQVKELFRRTVDTGIQHGTVTIMIGDIGYEVTTYRVDGVYEDHRRPKDVTFTACLSEDLKRRDFTINAMAYNDENGVIDIFGGCRDLQSGIIRCVGNPSDRFDEDALRILRAVRFSAQLGFIIDNETMVAMRAQAEHLRDISAERIAAELGKLLMSDNPDRLLTAYKLGITKIILPEFDAMVETEQNTPYHRYDVGRHTIKAIEFMPKKLYLKYTALFHDSGKPIVKSTDANGTDHFNGHQIESERIANSVLHRLKLDNETIALVTNLVVNHDYGIHDEITEKSFRRFLSKLGIDSFDDFILMKKADAYGKSEWCQDICREELEVMQECYHSVVDNNQCVEKKKLAIRGKDLIELGIKPGLEMGVLLNKLFELVLDNPELNDKDKLIMLVESGHLNN